MTSHVGRLYALALALLVFFVAWAVAAARPWASAGAADPRLRALAQREAKLRRQSVLVRSIVRGRWATYRRELAARKAALAAPAPAPSVRVVTLPPLTVTRTS